jgi:hypothetical protein
MADPLSFEPQIRWLPCVNNSSSVDIPGFALVRVVSIADDGTLTVDQPDTDNQAVCVMGPTGAPAGGGGLCTYDSPVTVLYDSDDGAPTLGTYWGAQSGDWQARLGYTGFTAIGVVASGNGWALMLRNSSADIPDATYTLRGLVNLTTQHLGAGAKYIDTLRLGSLGSSTDYGQVAYASKTVTFSSIVSGVGTTLAAMQDYTPQDVAAALGITNPNPDSSSLFVSTSGYVGAGTAFATGGVTPPTCTASGDNPVIGPYLTCYGWTVSAVTSFGETGVGSAPQYVSTMARLGDTIKWTRVNGATAYRLYLWYYDGSGTLTEKGLVIEIPDDGVTVNYSWVDDGRAADGGTLGPSGNTSIPTANQSGWQIGLDFVDDDKTYSGGIVIAWAKASPVVRVTTLPSNLDSMGGLSGSY